MIINTRSNFPLLWSESALGCSHGNGSLLGLFFICGSSEVTGCVWLLRSNLLLSWTTNKKWKQLKASECVYLCDELCFLIWSLLTFYYHFIIRQSVTQLDQSFSLSQLLWASWVYFVLYRYKMTTVLWSFSTIVSLLALCSAIKGSGCGSAPPLGNP